MEALNWVMQQISVPFADERFGVRRPQLDGGIRHCLVDAALQSAPQSGSGPRSRRYTHVSGQLANYS